MAHGGAKLLYPENTMLAFESCLQYGVDMLEMDVCLTKDHILVTHHNLTIDETSEATGAVADYTFEQLQQFNFGYRFTDLKGDQPYKTTKVLISSLEQVLKRFPDMDMIVEIKNNGEAGTKAADLLWELIEKYHAENRLIVASFYAKPLQYFRQISQGKVYTSMSKPEITKMVLLNKVGLEYFHHPKGSSIQVPTQSSGISLADERFINKMKQQGIATHFWTINDSTEMRKLINLKADGIITDRPDLLQALLGEYGPVTQN
ncbi:glycerophosphodiester phosphodiesterase [Limibacter armeniacum]|uniref:glycerophosphodiester phosphodiesterase n=1 Tax=Limibacter armeniacum TaxID=466084 RepID=UPI002FE67BF1